MRGMPATVQFKQSHILADPAQDGGTLKETHHHLDHDEPDDNPLQPGPMPIILVVPQHVQHLLQDLVLNAMEYKQNCAYY